MAKKIMISEAKHFFDERIEYWMDTLNTKEVNFYWDMYDITQFFVEPLLLQTEIESITVRYFHYN